MIQSFAHGTSNIAMERRDKPRLRVSYPAVVRGRDLANGKYQEEAQIDNLSATGLYLHLKRAIAPGSSLFIALHFSQKTSPRNLVPHLAARGTVVRSEVRQDGTCGLAIKFARYRFLD